MLTICEIGDDIGYGHTVQFGQSGRNLSWLER